MGRAYVFWCETMGWSTNKKRKHEYPYLVHLSYGKSNTTTMVKEPVSE